MSEICRFYGIVIKMFFKPKEHDPAHIHAIFDEYVGIFDIRTSEMMLGDLPPKAIMHVQEWLRINRVSLMEMWDSQKLHKLSPLK